MNNADLIIKIVKITNRNNQIQGYGMDCTSAIHRSQQPKPEALPQTAVKHKAGVRERFSAEAKTHVEIFSDGPNGGPIVLNGIQKSVSTTVTSKWCEDDERVSESSSTTQLKTYVHAAEGPPVS
jgi:hypothetical protein